MSRLYTRDAKAYPVTSQCELLGVSTQAYYKHGNSQMRKLAEEAFVVEFIRNIRLEQAARLLKEQKINVTQVAYTVGFSNLAHFSTIFRKYFGVAPSEYGEKSGGDKRETQ